MTTRSRVKTIQITRLADDCIKQGLSEGSRLLLRLICLSSTDWCFVSVNRETRDKIKEIVFQGYLCLKGNTIIFEDAVHFFRKFYSQYLLL